MFQKKHKITDTPRKPDDRKKVAFGSVTYKSMQKREWGRLIQL